MRVCLLLLAACTSSAQNNAEAAVVAELAATLSDAQQSLSEFHTAIAQLKLQDDQSREVLASVQEELRQLQWQYNELQAVHAELQVSHDALHLEHRGLQKKLSSARLLPNLPGGGQTGAEQLRRRALSSDDTCVEGNDVLLTVEGVAVFEDDLIVGSGDQQASVLDVVATSSSAAASVDALRDWTCLPSYSTTLAKPFQTIDTLGSIDHEHFRIGDADFLVEANFYNGSTYETTSVVYWFNGASASFEIYQAIETRGARGVESFTIGNRTFLAFAHEVHHGSYFVNSTIWCYNNATAIFEWFQDLATIGARDWTYFDIGDLYFLAVANHRMDMSSYHVQSAVYKFDHAKDTFELFQEIDTVGAFHWEHFAIDGENFLVVANHYNGTSYDVNSVVYRYNHVVAEFQLFQELPSKGAADFEHFRLGDADFLALANFLDGSGYAIASVVYRFNNATCLFEPFQYIDTTGAFDWEHFVIGDVNFLAVASVYDSGSYDATSVVYRYDVGTATFKAYQNISTTGARNWQHFRIAETNFLSITEYAWGGGDATTSVMLCNSFCFL